MKIGIDVQSTLGSMTGLGRYTAELTKAFREEAKSRHEFFFFKNGRDHLNTFGRLYWENVELPGFIRRDKLDLFHVPAFAGPFLKLEKLVVTVHDLIGMVFPNQMGWPSRFYWGAWLPLVVRKADILIADSENTKRDILKHLKVPETKIRVIYPSGHEGFSAQSDLNALANLGSRLGIKEKYFLFVGTIEPRKNLKRVIEAFAAFKKKRRSAFHQLVVVGSKDFGHGKAFEELIQPQSVIPAKASATIHGGHGSPIKIRQKSRTDPPSLWRTFGDDNFSKSIIFTGYLTQHELNTLYCGAEALIFPSLYEGFGIPVLEAMACGIPVLTSNISSLPEVAGNAALLVDPYQTAQIMEGMQLLAENLRLRQSFIERGFQQIQKFSWKKTALETIKVYESLE